uniref:Uncharacterized protein n=1 Tax=Florenciella parvula TaxID=236787 RepID=A0A7S2CH61_9STRA
MARALKRNKCLVALDISDNALGSHGVMAIADTLASDNSTLRSLSLDNTHAGVLGAEALARALGANDAQYLLPNRTQVETYTRGAVDGRDYGEKMGDPRGGLRELSLSANQIRNVGAIAFSKALAKNSIIQRIDMSFNEITPYGANALVDALAIDAASSSRDSKTLSLHIDLLGNEGCEDLIAPYLARAKVRWDFFGATRRSRLGSNPNPYPLGRKLVDPQIQDAFKRP